MLVEVALDAQRALRAIEQRGGLTDDPAVSEAAGLLSEIIGQEFDTTDESDSPRPRHGRQVRQIVSAHDPEMATPARPTRDASPATSCTPRPPARPRC